MRLATGKPNVYHGTEFDCCLYIKSTIPNSSRIMVMTPITVAKADLGSTDESVQKLLAIPLLGIRYATLARGDVGIEANSMNFNRLIIGIGLSFGSLSSSL